MIMNYSKEITILLAICLLSIIGILISSIVMINGNGMDQRLQGWVNLLWLPLVILFIIIDRICVGKFGVKAVNKVELYVLGILVILFIINWIRLQYQK
jgi:prepilin signal peptidase PulO-like enzyme (type II secretory pathway)